MQSMSDNGVDVTRASRAEAVAAHHREPPPEDYELPLLVRSDRLAVEAALEALANEETPEHAAELRLTVDAYLDTRQAMERAASVDEPGRWRRALALLRAGAASDEAMGGWVIAAQALVRDTEPPSERPTNPAAGGR